MNDARCELCNNPAKWIVSREYKDGRLIEGRYCRRCAEFVNEIERVYNRKHWWKLFAKRRSFIINDNIKYIMTELIDKNITIPDGRYCVLSMGFGRCRDEQ